MNKRLNLNALGLSLLSAGALALLFFIGTATSFFGFGYGSMIDYDVTSTHKNGVYTRTSENKTTGEYNVWSGTKDVQGRWDGPTSVELGSTGGGGHKQVYTVETVNYVEGRRNGKSVTTYADGHHPDEVVCYSMGKVIPCTETAAQKSVFSTASQRLFEAYPWYTNMLNVKGMDDVFTGEFVDTLETILLSMELDDYAFLDYYSDALDSLEGTRFDTIVSANSSLSNFMGQEELLHVQFRLAVLDKYRNPGSSTYEEVGRTYPGYLEEMNLAGYSNEDFEVFCREMDSIMGTYEPPVLEDPFFTDSVDSQMFRALYEILSYEDTTEAAASIKAAASLDAAHFRPMPVLRAYLEYLQPSSAMLKISPKSPEVGFAVFSTFLMPYFLGDKVSLVLEESFYQHHAIVTIPQVTTAYLGAGSSTSAQLNGYIHEDGGGSITAAGIAWATHYNPTLTDQTESAAASSGSFEVELSGLTEGETYFARAYATNSAGTAYGNCVEFVAKSTLGVEPAEAGTELGIWPNPASGLTTLAFRATGEALELKVYNSGGQQVMHRELGMLPEGEQQVTVDLSALPGGTYLGRICADGRVVATGKILMR